MLLRKLKNYFFIKKNLNVGKNTRILTSLSNFGSEPYLVKIGNECTITSGVKFITHDASVGIVLKYKNISRTINEKKYEIMSPIEIKDNCMIGVNSIILPGVTIGPNSIVGAGSIVTKDVPEGVIVAGNPAKIICTLDEYYSKIETKKILISKSVNINQRKQEILNVLSNKSNDY